MKSVKFLRRKNSIIATFNETIQKFKNLEEEVDKEQADVEKRRDELNKELASLSTIKSESQTLRKKFEDFVIV